MSFYHNFTSARTTVPDLATLQANLRALDSTAGVGILAGPTYRVKKATDWLPAHVTAAQNVIDTCPASTPQLTAQAEVDNLNILLKAIVLTIIDELNILRNLHGLPPRTPQQAITAIRNKAATL